MRGMATLTIATALTQYNENLDWDTSTVKARLALSALRFLKVNRAQNMSHVGTSLSFEAIEAEIKAIGAFLDSTNTTNRTSFTSARSRWT
jgi:hypothetical protein